jgi:hypothetical protein
MADHPSGYEKRDTSIRSILVATVVTVLVLVIAIVILYDYFIVTKEAVIYDQSLRPESEELIKVRQAEDSILNSYELIDPANRTYRVPISRAMELLAAESAGTTPQN